MASLFALAAWWCGPQRTALVFEPLLADWQRELDAARHAGRAQYAVAFASGLIAYARTFLKCTLTVSGWLPTSRAARIVALTFVCTFDIALFLLWIASLPSGLTLELSSLQTRYFLLSAAGLAFRADPAAGDVPDAPRRAIDGAPRRLRDRRRRRADDWSRRAHLAADAQPIFFDVRIIRATAPTIAPAGSATRAPRCGS
jgi:hypothetical protein